MAEDQDKSPEKPRRKHSTRQRGASKQTGRKVKGNAKRAVRSFPWRTLEEALKVPLAIREKNNGNPWATEDVAKASFGVARRNNKFFYAASAARDYGLTVGTRDTEKIELAPLGRDITFAGDETTKR